MKSTYPQPRIKHYSAKQLSFLYLVSKPTFLKWVEPHRELIGQRNGHYYTSAQVEIIFQKIGIPPLLSN